jgi:hypothetical protein
LNDVIESTENMGVSNPDNETGGDDSVENVPKETLGQENVEPDVSTSLGQPAKPSGEEENVSVERVPSVESDSENEMDLKKIVEKSHLEEGSDSGDDSKRNDEEADESVKDVVDIDKLNMEDVPHAQTLGDSMGKRLRSNKGKVVPSANKTSKKTDTTVTKTTKSRTKSAGVCPKKGWSKVMVKTAAGSSRKRKAVSSSEFEYDADMDVSNIIPYEFKKVDGKKDVLVVEDVPIDKVSFHLPSFAQRWKFIYHRRLALERELSDEALKIEELMSLIKEAGMEKTVCKLGECYEKLVREFLVNIPKDCDNPLVLSWFSGVKH